MMLSGSNHVISNNIYGGGQYSMHIYTNAEAAKRYCQPSTEQNSLVSHDVLGSVRMLSLVDAPDQVQHCSPCQDL